MKTTHLIDMKKAKKTKIVIIVFKDGKLVCKKKSTLAKTLTALCKK